MSLPRAVSGFALSSLLLGLTGFLVVPVVIHYSGPEAWAAVAVGQSIGLLGGLLTGYGWAVTGPSQVARSSLEAAGAELLLSVVVRSLLALVSLSLGFIIFIGPVGEIGHVAFLAYSGVALGGLSNFFFYVGTQKPAGFLFWEALPRCLFILVGIVFLVGGVSLEFSLVAISIGPIVACGLSTAHVARASRSRLPRKGLGRRVWHSLRGQRSGVSTNFLTALYFSVPVLIVSATSPGALAVYSVLDKLSKQGLSLLGPIVGALQGWVPRGHGEAEVMARVRRVNLVATAVLCATTGIFGIVGPSLVSVLSAGVLAVDRWEAVSAGFFFGAVAMERLVGRVGLLSLGESRQLVTASLVGSAVGLLALGPAAHLGGVVGATAAVGTGFLIMAGLEVRGMGRASR